ncbi:hypothetical protein MYIN104542_24140 [Mycobacterium intermedium]
MLVMSAFVEGVNVNVSRGAVNLGLGGVKA